MGLYERGVDHSKILSNLFISVKVHASYDGLHESEQ